MDSTAFGIVVGLLCAALFAAISWYNESTGEIVNPSPFRSDFFVREKHPRVFRSIQWFWKGCTILAFGFAAILALVAAATYRSSDYVQTSCEIDDANYADIGVKRAQEVGNKRVLESDIQFDETGIVLRLPGAGYAPPWSLISNVEMDYPSASAQAGRLSVQTIQVLGWKHLEVVGTVQRTCWDSVRRYLRRHVEERGIRIPYRETNGT